MSEPDQEPMSDTPREVIAEAIAREHEQRGFNYEVALDNARQFTTPKVVSALLRAGYVILREGADEAIEPREEEGT